MCIILHKPIRVQLPELQTLENCFNNNPDGAGFMYQHNNQVYIQKGFMSFNSLVSALNNLSQNINIINTNLTIHFRLASHGKVTPGNTHPFPITTNNKQLKAKSCITDLAIVHNGIIPFTSYNRSTSDTIIFVKDYLSQIKDSLFNPITAELIKHATKSKFIIMSPDNIQLIGEFLYNELDGCYYSNETYIDYWSKYYHKEEEQYNYIYNDI